MNDDNNPDLQGSDPVLATTSVPPIGASSADAEKPKVRRVLTKKRCRGIIATAMLVPMIGLSAGFVPFAARRVRLARGHAGLGHRRAHW